jgi:hypothetical protein
MAVGAQGLALGNLCENAPTTKATPHHVGNREFLISGRRMVEFEHTEVGVAASPA